MQHPDEGMIHAWIDGALDSEAARELEAHLAECQDCARVAAEARGLVAASSRILTALDNVPADVIPVARGASRTALRVRPWMTPFWMRTAASVLIVAGVSALFWTAKLNNPERKRAEMVAAAPRDEAPANLNDSFAVRTSAPSSDLASAPPSAAPAPSAPVAGRRPFSAKGGRSSTAALPETATVATAKDASAETADKERGLADKLAREERAAEAELAQKSLEKKTVVVAAPPAEAVRRDLAGNTVVDMSGKVSGMATSAARAAVGGAGSGQRSAAPSPAAPAAQSSAPSEPRLMRIEQQASSVRVHAATGCYALTLSPWSGGTIPFGAPPARIELDSLTSIQESIRGFYLVHPARGAASNGAPLAYWRAIGDSAFVTWRDDQRGVTLTLPLSGEVVQGNARTFSTSARDGMIQTAEVEARRISCRQ